MQEAELDPQSNNVAFQTLPCKNKNNHSNFEMGKKTGFRGLFRPG